MDFVARDDALLANKCVFFAQNFRTVESENSAYLYENRKLFTSDDFTFQKIALIFTYDMN